MDFTIERIESVAQLRALEPEWRALEARSGCELPFLTFDWTITWWSYLHEEKLGVRDCLFVHVLRSQAGALVGVAPLMITRRPGFGPLSARELQFIGADPNMTELRGVLAHPDQVEVVHRALLEELRKEASRWDWMVFSGIPARESASVAALDALYPERVWTRDIPDFVVPLPDNWETLRGTLPRNIKESLRKCYNAPKRDGHELALEVVRTPADAASAVDLFLRLHSARASLEGTVRHNDVFSSAQAQRFLHELCARFAARGCLRIFILKLDGKAVAARIGFVMGDSLYLYYSGFDPAFARYSVMTTTVAEAIKYAIEQRFARVNLSTGNDVSKTRWNPQEITYREAFVVSPRRVSALTHSAFSHARKLVAAAPLRRSVGKLLGRRSA